MENKKLKRPLLVTHDSTFHADDVFATATLAIFLNDDYELIRTRDVEIIAKADYVYDVGGEKDFEKNRFDHHQIGGAGVRKNGIPYASFGLVWEKFGEELCGSKKVADVVGLKLVQGVDAQDNGLDLYNPKENVVPYVIQQYLYSLRPTWCEEADYDGAFKEAVVLAKNILFREIKIAKDNQEGYERVYRVYDSSKNKKLIVLNEKLPWEYALVEKSEPQIVVALRPDGRWKAEATFVSHNSSIRRIKFPKSWAGLRDFELQNETGVIDAVFCHNGLFMVVALSKEGALKLAEKALESNI